MRALAFLALVACGTDPAAPPQPGEIALVVTSPVPGAELVAAEHPAIVVTGTIATTEPRVGALEVWVNGARVEVAADGSFTADLEPSLGVNHVDVEGGDGVGVYVAQEMDVLWAPAYLPPNAGTTGFDLEGALDLRLGQRFFDPRVFDTTLDLTTDPVVARDLASALELIIWHIDLASLLDGAIQVGGGTATLDVTIPSAAPSQIVVDARIVEGNAITLDINLLGVFLATDGTFRFGNRTLLVDGGITADMHASARLELAVAGDTIDVTVTNVTATVGPLVPQFDGPNGDELDAFITIGGNDFRSLVEGLITTDLVPAFTEQVPPLLEALLGATGDVLDDVSFPLDPGLGNPITLMLDGTTGGLEVVPGPTLGHVTVRQNIAIRTTGSPIHTTTRGAPRIDAMPEQSFGGASSVGVNLRQDFLNTLLHALWNSGLLEGNATFGGLTAGLSAKLPPVLLPTPPESSCKIDGVRCDVLVQLGQIEVQLADFEQSFAVNATAGARILVEGNTISLVIQQTPTLRVWETSTGGDGQLSPEAVADVIADVVWPELFGAIGENLSITLPIPDLAELGLTKLAPGLANAQLELVMRNRPSVATGYLGLGADLELATPPP